MKEEQINELLLLGYTLGDTTFEITKDGEYKIKVRLNPPVFNDTDDIDELVEQIFTIGKIKMII
jgi:hypothetical protein